MGDFHPGKPAFGQAFTTEDKVFILGPIIMECQDLGRTRNHLIQGDFAAENAAELTLGKVLRTPLHKVGSRP